MTKGKTIGLSKENWKILSQLKLDEDLEDFNTVITYLLENQRIKKGN